MAYCDYCGQQIPEGASFCSSCGAPAPVAQSVTETEQTTSVSQDPSVVEGAGEYSLIVVSLGDCTKAAAGDLLEDVLGYSSDQAEELFEMLPAQAAQQLTYDQAQYLAKAMTEYGMEVSVRSGSGYISVDEDDTDSVFDNSGSFLKKIAGILGLITGKNRMKKFRRLTDQRYYEKPFRTETYRPQRPVYTRRPLQRENFRDMPDQMRPQQHVPQQHAPQQHFSRDNQQMRPQHGPQQSRPQQSSGHQRPHEGGHPGGRPVR